MGLFKINKITAGDIDGFQQLKEAGQFFCQYAWHNEHCNEIQLNITWNLAGYELRIDPGDWLNGPLKFTVSTKGIGNGEESLKQLAVQYDEKWVFINMGKYTFFFYNKKETNDKTK